MLRFLAKVTGSLGVVVAVALILSLPACSSSSGSRPDAAPLPPEVLGGDPTRSQAALLRLEDFPAGWVEQPVEDQSDPRNGLERCREMLEGEPHGRTAVARSNEFQHEANGVSEQGWFYESEAAAAAAFDMYFGDSSRGCVRDAIASVAQESLEEEDEEIPGGFEVSTEVGDLSVEKVGDDSAGWGVVSTLEARGVALPVYVDIVVVRVGRVLLEILFFGAFAPFDAGRAEILDRAFTRARDALAT